MIFYHHVFDCTYHWYEMTHSPYGVFIDTMTFGTYFYNDRESALLRGILAFHSPCHGHQKAMHNW